MTTPKDDPYYINFFRPHSKMSRDDNRVITTFIVIWAIAVFGFQFLLIGTNKMVPESTLISFNENWPRIQNGEANLDEQKAFSRDLLKVLGKNIVLAESDKTVLKEALSLTLMGMANGEALDPASASALLELKNEGFDQLMIELLPFSIVAPSTSEYSTLLPGIVEKYCTHPQGPLTNFTFLGFPFHYWYTAQFLLILFVLLCLFYAITIDKIHVKHGFKEDQN